MKVLIVDDEPLARERISSLLKVESDIEIVGECAGGEEALEKIAGQRPDLVFLDIQMPEMTGFEMLQHIENPLPLVIFVTAYDQHALKAFEVHALDYLLKPFKQVRFKEALNRAREQLSGSGSGAASNRITQLLAAKSSEQPFLSRLVIKDSDRVRFVKVEDVDWVESSGNYLVVHSGKENHIIRDTLTALETRLNPRKFIRISRSAIVNQDRIKEIQPLFNDEHVIVLSDGKQINMTRGLREVQELMRFS